MNKKRMIVNSLCKLLIISFLAMCCPTDAFAASWKDVTEFTLDNPSFDSGNINGWNIDVSSYQNGGYQGAWYSNDAEGVWISGFVEVWRPAPGILGDGTISQTVTLPKGKYRLHTDAIAVYQSGWNYGGEGVSLFAKQVDGTVTSIEMATGNNSPQHFMLEFEVKQAGDIMLGIMISNTEDNWVAADNFVLEMDESSIVSATSISVNPSSLTMSIGDEAQITPVFTPSNASFKKCEYSSDDESVAKVNADGVVTAFGVGTTNIRITSKAYPIRVQSCKVQVKAAEYVPGAIVINEIQASNIDMFLDPSMNYGSWIELYNSTDKSCGLAGLYVSDDPANLKKHKLAYNIGSVPAHGYKNIWFDHYGIWKEGELKQVDFKLDYDGGTIIISDGATIIAQQDYPQAVGRTSYARTKDGGSEWATSATPTPEQSNAGMSFAETQLPMPVVDTDGKLFSGSLQVRVTVPSGATLKYTTDGTVPTATNGQESKNGAFTVSESTVYRFRLFQNGYLPSDVVTRSYINDDSNLPVISVVTERDNIYSKERGLFAKGPNGRPGNGQNDNCNWNMEWDRPVNFEYITENNEYALSQEVDMSMCGGWSRANSPHSFKIKAAKYYQGNNSLDYQFFEEKPFLKHKVLQIRNGGSGDRLKDASLQEIMRRSGLNIDTQSWKPVRVYINGEFYANLNMREPNNKHFAYANYGIDTDEMDQFEMSPDSGYVQMAGTKESFDKLIELSYDASDSNTYEEIGKLLDIDEYINYMAAELYLGNWDWPQNNVKGFRDQTDGRFRFVVYDLDGAFSADLNTFRGKKYYTFDSLRGEDGFGNSLWNSRISEEIEIVTLFENMLQNEDFRRRFVDAICVMGGSVFHPDYVYEVAHEMSQTMNYGSGTSIKNNFTGRQANIASQLQWGVYDFGVDGIEQQEVALSSNVDGAQIHVNDTPVPMGRFEGMLYPPVTVKAFAPAGYSFKGWRLASGSLGSGETSSVFGKGSTWYYYDEDGGVSGSAWKSSVISSWKSGKAPIGYDTNYYKDISTWVDNYPLQTYYVAKSFTISNAASTDKYVLDYTVDDGMVVYVNGKEAGRYNMTNGNVDFYTNGGWAQGNPDSGKMELPASLFKNGVNTIAVEVHNYFNPSSSDIYWDAALLRTVQTGGAETVSYVSTKPEYKIPEGSSLSLVAEYEPLPESELAESVAYPVKVNEVSAGNTMYVSDYFKKDDWVELYNTTDQPIDIAGMYLSDNEAKPQKFQIPDNDDQQTVIAPHSHLIVWASKRDNIGEQIHASFKLSNADGEKVILTSADGKWHDILSYTTHDGKESVGLYPDGGKEVYSMQLPTIGKANTLTSFAKYLYTSTYDPVIDDDDEPSFTLNLTEGWNWMSHPLERNVAIAEINEQALRIVGKDAETAKNAANTWTGTLTELAPTSSYKVQMAADASCKLTGNYFADGNTIALAKGWNWIGYPVNATQSIAEALSKFTPSEGDILVGQDGFATYENGTWSGSLEMLTPGTGYMYKAISPRSLAFTSSASSSAKARFHAQPATPWTASSASHPDVMGVVARIVANGAEAESGAYSIGAFTESGECRGLGKYIDGKLFITIFGDGNQQETIHFLAASASTSIVYEVAETLLFASDVKGSRKAPFTLTLGASTGIASAKSSAALSSLTYYTLSGVSTGSDKSTLAPGVYVAKYVLKDGSVITKKVIKN